MNKSIIVFLGLLVILLTIGTSNMNIANANAIASNDSLDRKQVSVSSLKCNNINVNVNGLELDVFPPFLADSGLAAEAVEGNADTNSFTGNGDNSASEINDIRFICINNNNNTVIEKEQTPASLTVKKQLFGCTPINQFEMNCSGLRNNSTEWLDCSNSSISNSIFCQSLPASIFDIELRDQNTQIQQFEGSTEGTVIQNLEPGTYIVNEIKNATFAFDQLIESANAERFCVNNGFADGGTLDNSTAFTLNAICLEYKDEQGNNCSTVILAEGEERTCIVKNYILNAGFPN